jgi:type IV pilus assembly protein PilQ
MLAVSCVCVVGPSVMAAVDSAAPTGTGGGASPTAPAAAPIPVPGLSNLFGASTAGAPGGAQGNGDAGAASAGSADATPVEAVRTGKDGGQQEGQSVRPGQVNVSETGTVEIHVVDANLLEVLRMLAAQSQKNIVASKDVHGVVTASLYDVTIKEALDAMLQSNGFAYREKGNFIYVYTVKELQDLEKATRKPQVEVFRLFYTPAANAVNMVKPVLSPEAQVSFTTPAVTGISTGTSDVGGNSHATDDVMVVTDYPENLDKVREVLKEVDRRPQQILVEATILRAALTEDNSLGIDFTILGGVDFTSITGLGGNAGAGILQPSVLQNTAANSVISRQYGGGNTGFTNGLPQNGLRLGFVSNNIAVFLQALETVTDTTVLANPKILALNKQKGEVIVGRKDGYLTTTVTSSSSTQTVEFLDTGTRLIFRPFIGDDGYIRMEIHPEDSSGGLTSNANLPFKITTEVTSNVMVKDGRTIVIGGLFREATDSSKSQVPFLGNIPLAGYLFKNQRDRTTREEIIILLTPHIIKDDDGYAADSIKAEKDFEKLRVGVRKGLMPTGRERLAEISYENAVAELNKPNPDRSKAMWNLDMATNLNPKYAEAIALKEKLSGKEATSSDNAVLRGFLRKRVQAESALPPSTRPASIRLSEPRARRMEGGGDGPAATATPTPAPVAATAAAPAPTPVPVPTAAAPTATPAPAPVSVPAPVSPLTAKPETPVADRPKPSSAISVTDTPEEPASAPANTPASPAPTEQAAAAPSTRPSVSVSEVEPAK